MNLNSIDKTIELYGLIAILVIKKIITKIKLKSQNPENVYRFIVLFLHFAFVYRVLSVH